MMEPAPESISACVSDPTPRRKSTFFFVMTVLFTAFTTVIFMAITLWYLDIDVPDTLDRIIDIGYSLLDTLNVPRVIVEHK